MRLKHVLAACDDALAFKDYKISAAQDEISKRDAEIAALKKQIEGMVKTIVSQGRTIESYEAANRRPCGHAAETEGK